MFVVSGYDFFMYQDLTEHEKGAFLAVFAPLTDTPFPEVCSILLVIPLYPIMGKYFFLCVALCCLWAVRYS